MSRKLRILLFVLIAVFAVSIHGKHLFQFPTGIHSWSQTDNLALANGFLRNHFNFFHPQTYLLNKEFVIYDTPIAAAGFPINNYVVALMMKVSGSRSVAHFRIFMLLFSCVGLYFLGLFVYRKTQSLLTVFGILLLLFGSAVYLDYQDGLIPSMSAMSCAFIALNFLDLYRRTLKRKYFVTVIASLSLATLMRIPFGLFLIALALESLFQKFRKKEKIPTFDWLLISIGALIPVVYFVYNLLLAKKYGSLLLSKTATPESLREIKEILSTTSENWLMHYWSLGDYIALFALVFMALFVALKLCKNWSAFFDNRLLLWSFISIFGGLAYMLLMLRQFPQHDYYILDSLFPVVIIFLAVLITVIYRHIQWKKIAALILLGLSIYGFTDAQKLLAQRRTTGVDSVEAYSFRNYEKVGPLLERLNITQDNKILTADTYAPNLPLILLDREGYSVPYPTVKTTPVFMAWDWEYLLLQDYSIERLFVVPYPQLMDSLERVGGDGRISVFRKRNEVSLSPRSMTDIMEIDSKKPFLIKMGSTDESNTIEQDSIGFYKKLDTSSEFGEENIEISGDSILSDDGIHLVAEMNYRLKSTIDEVFISVTLFGKDNEPLTWQAVKLTEIETDVDIRTLKKFFAIPHLTVGDRLVVTLWNPGGNKVDYDKIKVSLYSGAD